MFVVNPLLHNKFSKRIYPGTTRQLTKSTRTQSTRVQSRDLVAIKRAMYQSKMILYTKKLKLKIHCRFLKKIKYIFFVLGSSSRCSNIKPDG